MRKLWRFFDAVPPERQEYLLSHDSFSGILVGIRLLSGEKHWIWDWARHPSLRGCARVGFRVDLPDFLVDAFFNSPVGYRAQYAARPRNGERANRALIEMLRHSILMCTPPMCQARTQASLSGRQAKVWIDEDEPEVQQHLGETTPEINFPRWIRHSDTAVGLRAPVGSRLIVYGGWIDESGTERLNLGKISRSEDIFREGFH